MNAQLRADLPACNDRNDYASQRDPDRPQKPLPACVFSRTASHIRAFPAEPACADGSGVLRCDSGESWHLVVSLGSVTVVVRGLELPATPMTGVLLAPGVRYSIRNTIDRSRQCALDGGAERREALRRAECELLATGAGPVGIATETFLQALTLGMAAGGSNGHHRAAFLQSTSFDPWLYMARNSPLCLAVNDGLPVPSLGLLAALCDDRMEATTAEGLAREYALSRFQLIRRVRAMVGSTPSQLQRQLRVRRAVVELLRRNGTINEVARQFGFCNGSHLTSACRNAMGMSPMEIVAIARRQE